MAARPLRPTAEPGTRGRALLVAAIIAGAACALALACWFVWPDVRLLVAAHPALLVGLVGLLAAAVVGAIGWVRDRDRRRQEDAARQARADRLHMLSRVDHELKNPIMALRLAQANLASAPAGSPESTQALNLVGTQTGRLVTILGDLRKVVDVEHRDLDLQQLNLADLLAEITETMAARQNTDRREIRLSVPRAPWPVPMIIGDPDLVYLALYNVVDNAMKYTRPGDTIEVRLTEPADGVVLVEVADTGAGIPADEGLDVWEEFTRARTSRGIPGSGLGLPLVRAIMDRHGGTAALRSRVGHGTVVSLGFATGGRTPPSPKR